MMWMARILPLLLVLALMLALPGGAGAASTWASQPTACGGSTTERGSGQMDDDGKLYVACSKIENGNYYHHVRIYGTDGGVLAMVPLMFDPAENLLRLAADVAPSPHGEFLYVIRYDQRLTYRFNRVGGPGTYQYRVDPTWRLAAFPGAGGGAPAYQPRGMFLATDRAGDIYFSSGLWSDGLGVPVDHTIVKYRADGSYVTRFGLVGNSWATGTAYDEFTGIAVTADGRRVFVADKLNSRVHRFDRTGATYAPVLTMGNTQASDPGRGGQCLADGVLASPYDLALSPSGAINVISTTCFYTGGAFGTPDRTAEVQRWSQGGRVLGMVHATTATYEKVHGISVDRIGRIHLAQGGVVLLPPAGLNDAGAGDGGPGPMGYDAPIVPGGGGGGPIVGAPDQAAPVISSATAPATTTAAAITLALAATDDRAVTEVRVREDGVQYGWRPWATSLPHTLSGGNVEHVLEIQVRDAAGNLSAPATVRITQVAPPAPKPSQPGTPRPVLPATPGAPVAGGGGSDTTRPLLTAVTMSPQVPGRSLVVRLRASDEVGVTLVRFATENGRWGSWRTLRSSYAIRLTSGQGWKGVFVQVRDAAGNRSRGWYQSVLSAPRTAHWVRGSAKADRMRMAGGREHADLSAYDGRADRITCGGGSDTVLLQPEDAASADCERVVRLVTPKW